MISIRKHGSLRVRLVGLAESTRGRPRLRALRLPDDCRNDAESNASSCQPTLRVHASSLGSDLIERFAVAIKAPQGAPSTSPRRSPSRSGADLAENLERGLRDAVSNQGIGDQPAATHAVAQQQQLNRGAEAAVVAAGDRPFCVHLKGSGDCPDELDVPQMPLEERVHQLQRDGTGERRYP